MTKYEPADPFDGILGSSAIGGVLDTALAFLRFPNKPYRTLQSRQRYGPDLPETTLPFDEKTGMVSLGSLRADADASLAGQRILDVLVKVGKPVTERYLEEAGLGKTEVWKPALRKLVDFGTVLRVDQQRRPNPKGGRGNPFHYVPATNPVQQAPGPIEARQRPSKRRRYAQAVLRRRRLARAQQQAHGTKKAAGHGR
jgi:hypothetical protein